MGYCDLALAAHMVVRFLPDPLHFVDNAGISSSTNPLEGYFSRVKENYRRHRALPRKYREHYFQRYFFLHLDKKQQHFLNIIPAKTGLYVVSRPLCLPAYLNSQGQAGVTFYRWFQTLFLL
jgi:hypothetical protein